MAWADRDEHPDGAAAGDGGTAERDVYPVRSGPPVEAFAYLFMQQNTDISRLRQRTSHRPLRSRGRSR
jgi:hypothetical protein